MKRRGRLACAAAMAAIVTVALLEWHVRSGAHADMVRVGGDQNPCACTQRIEP